MTTSDLTAQAEPALLGGRYELHEVIDRGGMADVHRATDIKLGRPVAVKLLRGGSGEETDRTRFIAEARMLARLSHSGLVTVFDAGFGAPAGEGDDPVSAQQAFLVMELVEGPTLAQLMADGPLPLTEVAAVGAQVAEALAYVHAKGVVHRDVKPANVLRDRDQRVKLADFGIARLLGQASRQTKDGEAVGTAAYLAPEQVQGGEIDGTADVYALGLVLLEAITGRREYEGTPTEAALARLSRPPAIPEDLPPEWQDLLTAMTALEAGHRPSAQDVAASLRQETPVAAPVGFPTPADTASAPILADEPVVPIDGGPTQPMPLPPTEPPAEPPTEPPAEPPTEPPAAPPTARTPTPPATSAIDRAGDAVASGANRTVRRLRSLPSDAIGVVAAMVALLVLLVVAAVVADGGAGSAVPDDTPSELRGPLEDLHQAINGDDG